jgi:hypothetical protein
MEFPPNWQIFEAEEFASAMPRAAGELGAELLVQARPNGRMLDHFRVTMGGSRILDVSFPVSKIINMPAANAWKLKIQVWPRDVVLRRNMTTSEWTNIDTIIAAKDGCVMAVAEDRETEVPHAEVLACFEELGAAAAVRYTVVVGGDQHLVLMLQGLPATAETLAGKPAFRG